VKENRSPLLVFDRDLDGRAVVASARPDELGPVLDARLLPNRERQAVLGCANLLEGDARRSVEVARLHGPDEGLGAQRLRPDHHPAPPGVHVLCAELVVVVGVVHGEAVHRLLSLGQPLREQDVPHPLGAGTRRVSFVSHRGMTVVDLEEPLAPEGDQVLHLDRPSEVRMVDVGEHELAGPLPLVEDGVDVSLHHVAHAGPALRLDELTEVGGVQMDGLLLELVRDLFALDHEKPIGLFEEASILGEGLQPDEVRVAVLLLLDPFVPEALPVAREHGGAPRGLEVDPPLSLGEDVVIRQDGEVVPVGLVPVEHHLRVVVAVAPQGVGVKVALPPPGGLLRRCGDAGGQGHDRQDGKEA
jgi:hypothetical protein